MTDLADYTPGPACLAARERLLEGIMETWPKTRAKPVPVPAPVDVDTIAINLMDEKRACNRLLNKWQVEVGKKQKLLEECGLNHSSPGDNYWLPEAKARARYIVASNFVEMLEKARDGS